MSGININTWQVPRESQEWVGPITVTATVDGDPVEIDAANLKFAAIARGSRPVTADWLDPVAEPGGTALGIQADPVDAEAKLGIWVKITDSSEVPVLDPTVVGFIHRT